MLRAILIAQIWVLAAAVWASGQQPADVSKPHAACGAVEEDFGRQPRSPVVWGKPFTVPKFRLLVTDERTGAPVAGREVIVRYVWRWFEYPYQEHPLGVWSDAYDLVRCRTDARGVVEMSEFEVVPRGWYKGKLLMGRKPEFTHLDVSIELEKHLTHRTITRKDLKRHKDNKADTIPLSVPVISPL
jgi:hypothetical protein